MEREREQKKKGIGTYKINKEKIEKVKVKKGKDILLKAVEAHRVARG
jgi:hypothetical protein